MSKSQSETTLKKSINRQFLEAAAMRDAERVDRLNKSILAEARVLSLPVVNGVNYQSSALDAEERADDVSGVQVGVGTRSILLPSDKKRKSMLSRQQNLRKLQELSVSQAEPSERQHVLRQLLDARFVAQCVGAPTTENVKKKLISRKLEEIEALRGNILSMTSSKKELDDLNDSMRLKGETLKQNAMVKSKFVTEKNELNMEAKKETQITLQGYITTMKEIRKEAQEHSKQHDPSTEQTKQIQKRLETCIRHIEEDRIFILEMENTQKEYLNQAPIAIREISILKEQYKVLLEKAKPIVAQSCQLGNEIKEKEQEKEKLEKEIEILNSIMPRDQPPALGTQRGNAKRKTTNEAHIGEASNGSWAQSSHERETSYGGDPGDGAGGVRPDDDDNSLEDIDWDDILSGDNNALLSRESSPVSSSRSSPSLQKAAAFSSPRMSPTPQVAADAFSRRSLTPQSLGLGVSNTYAVGGESRAERVYTKGDGPEAPP